MDSLRSRIGTRSMGVYPVDYPATTDFPTAISGVRDATAHVEATARNCPNTNMVLGGFSQGAAVMGFVTSDVIPDGAPEGVPNPMPPDIADHVAAVALFGTPNDRFMHAIGQPDVTVGPTYTAKTIELCVPDDFVCSQGRDFNAHTQYADSGMVDQAAAYTATEIAARPVPAAPALAPVPGPHRGYRPSLPHLLRRLHLSHLRQRLRHLHRLLPHPRIRLLRRHMTLYTRSPRERCCCAKPLVRCSGAVDRALTCQ